MSTAVKFLAMAAVAVACVSGAEAVDIQTVPVGNPGNTGENSGESEPGGYGPDRICGAVEYVYNIGKFEVTAGQYAEFLNAVAAEDTHGLYNTSMWTSSYGCKIRRTGSPGSYAYLVDADGDDVEDADWLDRPVNYVSWGDAARFCNWLHNGQLTGAQDLSTTEDGAYYLNGATSDGELMAVVREADGTWVIPSEDEWYKAAYHHNDGTTANYYDYPMGSDSVPVCECCPGGSNWANWDCNGDGPGGHACGGPYYRNVVGCYVDSASPYGTFDQGGNVWEWNEADLSGTLRGLRGGAFYNTIENLHAALRNGDAPPTHEALEIGFRVAYVGQDSVPTLSEWGLVAMTLLILTAGTLVYARRQVDVNAAA